MYRWGAKYQTKPGRTYFFIPYPGMPEGKFTKAIETYCNALINSNGGILVFGVDNNERITGFELTRQQEDAYKLNFDAAIRQMKPTIHPHQYRLDVVYLQQSYLALFEIRMTAGIIEEIYENSKRQMYIVKDKQLYGPLVPCEITQIVLAKYKEELSSLIIENNQRQIIAAESDDQPQDKTCKPSQNENTTHTAKKTRFDKITWP